MHTCDPSTVDTPLGQVSLILLSVCLSVCMCLSLSLSPVSLLHTDTCTRTIKTSKAKEAQGVKVLSHNLDNTSLIPRSHMTKGDTQLPTLPFDLYMYSVSSYNNNSQKKYLKRRGKRGREENKEETDGEESPPSDKIMSKIGKLKFTMHRRGSATLF